MKKRRNDAAALLARGQMISAELYQSAVATVRRVGEVAEEDIEQTIGEITTRYRALMTAAEEAAISELVALYRSREVAQEFDRLRQDALLVSRPKLPANGISIKAEFSEGSDWPPGLTEKLQNCPNRHHDPGDHPPGESRQAPDNEERGARRKPHLQVAGEMATS
jgi:hypothetical protein